MWPSPGTSDYPIGFLVSHIVGQVPLNYSNPEGASAALALVRSVASVPEDSSDYLGPILLNPGGPGFGGVDFVLGSLPVLRSFLGPQYDLVGFDPRGAFRFQRL